MVDRRVHRGRRSGVRRADPAARRRRTGRGDASPRRRLRRGPDQPAGGATRRRRAGRRRRSDVEPDQRCRRARWRAVSPGRPPTSSRSPMAGSTPWSPASCSSTSTRSTRRSPRSPGCSHPAGGSASSSTTRCCRRPTAGGSTTRWSSRRSSTGASAATSRRPRRSRRSSSACTSASSTVRCRATSTPSPTAGCTSSGWSSRNRLPGSSPSPRSTPKRRPCRACSTSAVARSLPT